MGREGVDTEIFRTEVLVLQRVAEIDRDLKGLS